MALIDVQIGMPTFLDLVRAQVLATDLPAEARRPARRRALPTASPSRPWNWSTVRLAAAGSPDPPRDTGARACRGHPSMRQTARDSPVTYRPERAGHHPDRNASSCASCCPSPGRQLAYVLTAPGSGCPGLPLPW